MRRPPEGRRRGDQKEEEFRHGKTAGNISPKRKRKYVPHIPRKKVFSFKSNKKKEKKGNQNGFFSPSLLGSLSTPSSVQFDNQKA